MHGQVGTRRHGHCWFKGALASGCMVRGGRVQQRERVGYAGESQQGPSAGRIWDERLAVSWYLLLLAYHSAGRLSSASPVATACHRRPSGPDTTMLQL